MSLSLDDHLDQLLEVTPTVAEFDPDDATAQALISDVALRMNKYSTVAMRYGMTMEQLHKFCSIPEVLRRIKARRAQWESEDNLVERNRRYYGTVVLEAAPVFDRLLHDHAISPQHKNEMLKTIGRLAGLEANPRQTDAQNGQTGPQFSVQILFSGGAVERINTVPLSPVIEGEAA